MASAPRSPAMPRRLPVSGKAIGLEMTPPSRERHRQRARHHAALGEGDAAEQSGEAGADLIGERLEGGLEGELRQAERERAQHVAEALAAQGDVDEGVAERAAEARAEARGVGELLLQRAGVGVDDDGEGRGGFVGHLSVSSFTRHPGRGIARGARVPASRDLMSLWHEVPDSLGASASASGITGA